MEKEISEAADAELQYNEAERVSKSGFRGGSQTTAVKTLKIPLSDLYRGGVGRFYEGKRDVDSVQ